MSTFRRMRPFYHGFGTNGALVPFDRAAGRVILYPGRILATISGNTLTPDSTTCWQCPGSQGTHSIKFKTFPSQNQSAVLEQLVGDPCLFVGFPANSIVYDDYDIKGCSDPAHAFPRSMDWRVTFQLIENCAHRFTFEIVHGPNTVCENVQPFYAVSDSICFPMTLTNLIGSGAAGGTIGPFDCGGPSKRLGYGGTVTLSLPDQCP